MKTLADEVKAMCEILDGLHISESRNKVLVWDLKQRATDIEKALDIFDEKLNDLETFKINQEAITKENDQRLTAIEVWTQAQAFATKSQITKANKKFLKNHCDNTLAVSIDLR